MDTRTRCECLCELHACSSCLLADLTMPSVCVLVFSQPVLRRSAPHPTTCKPSNSQAYECRPQRPFTYLGSCRSAARQKARDGSTTTSRRSTARPLLPVAILRSERRLSASEARLSRIHRHQPVSHSRWGRAIPRKAACMLEQALQEARLLHCRALNSNPRAWLGRSRPLSPVSLLVLLISSCSSIVSRQHLPELPVPSVRFHERLLAVPNRFLLFCSVDLLLMFLVQGMTLRDASSRASLTLSVLQEVGTFVQFFLTNRTWFAVVVFCL